MQSTCEISHRFGITDSISRVSRYGYCIQDDVNRDDVMQIPEANRLVTHREPSREVVFS